MGESLGLGKKSSGPKTDTDTWSWFQLLIPKPGFGRTLAWSGGIFRKILSSTLHIDKNRQDKIAVWLKFSLKRHWRTRSWLFSAKLLCFENKIIQSTSTDKSRDVENEIYWSTAHIITPKMRQTENIRIIVLSNSLYLGLALLLQPAWKPASTKR